MASVEVSSQRSRVLVGSVRLEQRRDASALHTSHPRLSWTVQTEDSHWRQTGYEIELRLGEHDPIVAHVDSNDQVGVPWPHQALTSRDRGSVRVRVIGETGTSEFSAPLAFEVGLLSPLDWSAIFISGEQESGSGPAPILFSTAEFPTRPVRARLYVSALGSYLFSINGHRVGEDVLAPGWTSYPHRLRYFSYDVTELLEAGTNRLQAMIGNGWFHGRLGWPTPERGERRHLYGDQRALLAQLEVTFADGQKRIIGTDESWRASAGPILFDDLYDGQHTDLRISADPWAADASPAYGVQKVAWDLSTLIGPIGPPIKITQRLSPVHVGRSPSGKLLVDFGQNLVGWVRVPVSSGAAGNQVIIRHAEVLEDQELGSRPLRSAQATDRYWLAEGDQILEPTFTFHGFRYAEITGLDEDQLGAIEAVVLHSDLERTGDFSCSDEDLNQLHSNVVWGMRGNFVDVPTDCPQRDERLGWTGDIEVFSPTASFLFDCDGFLNSWLADLAAEQLQDGSVPYVIPDILHHPESPAGAAWGDAATVVPSVLYERFGDRDVLARQLPSMKAWVDKISGLAGENGLWQGGFQFGDWLDPTAPPEAPGQAQADPDVVASAYLIRSAQLVARAAEVLGRDDDHDHYSRLAAHSLAAFQQTYVSGEGRVHSDCPTVYSLAIVWDLLRPEQRSYAGRRLAELVSDAGFTISTGFVGTPLIMDALCRTDQVETAYRLLLQRECPSWLYPVTMGATTIWERWDSMLPDGSINPGEMTSFNHYALGAVADWLHRSLAGLAPAEPGYRTVLIAPVPGGGITNARAALVGPYGPIEVSWEREAGLFTLTAIIPPGSTGQVRLPGTAELISVGHGRHQWTTPVSMTDVEGK